MGETSTGPLVAAENNAVLEGGPPPMVEEEQPEWVQDFVEAIWDSVPSRASWRVLERCAARATRDYRVCLQGREDKGEPRVLHPAKWEDIPEAFPEEVLMDAVEGSMREALLGSHDKQSPVEVGAAVATVEKNSPDEGAHSVAPWKGEVEGRILLDRERLIYPHLKGIALVLDTHFIGLFGGSGQEMNREYEEAKTFTVKGMGLAVLLNKFLGKRVRDIAIALILRCSREYEEWKGRTERLEHVVNLSITTDAKKVELLDEMTKGYPDDLTEEGMKKTLQWVLGEKRWERLSAKKRFAGDWQKIPEYLWKAFSRSRRLRESIFSKFFAWLHTPEKILTSSLVRLGWRELLKAREVTDHEYWRDVRERKEREVVTDGEKLREKIASFSERVAATVDEGEKKTLEGEVEFFEELLKEGEEELQRWRERVDVFFRDHPEEKRARLLADAVRCDDLRGQLRTAAVEGHVPRIAALQAMVALEAYRQVSRYPSGREHVSSAEEERNGSPSYLRGFPPHIVETKEASCMGSVWVTAALLLRAGIPPESLKYCHVNQLYPKEDEGGMMGPHGQLLLLTEEKEALIIDQGWGACGRRLPLMMSSGKTYVDMHNLLSGERSAPVRFETSSAFSHALKIPQSMIVMPVFDGFASEHLWHVGIEFLHEGKLAEAERALQLALSFCPIHPDVLYYLGLTWSRMGDQEGAKECFRRALEVFEGHLRSHFALGELALGEGDKGEALKRFKRVAQDENPVWGDDVFKVKAVEYCREQEKAKDEVLTYEI